MVNNKFVVTAVILALGAGFVYLNELFIVTPATLQKHCPVCDTPGSSQPRSTLAPHSDQDLDTVDKKDLAIITKECEPPPPPPPPTPQLTPAALILSQGGGGDSYHTDDSRRSTYSSSVYERASNLADRLRASDTAADEYTDWVTTTKPARAPYTTVKCPPDSTPNGDLMCLKCFYENLYYDSGASRFIFNKEDKSFNAPSIDTTCDVITFPPGQFDTITDEQYGGVEYIDDYVTMGCGYHTGFFHSMAENMIAHIWAAMEQQHRGWSMSRTHHLHWMSPNLVDQFSNTLNYDSVEFPTDIQKNSPYYEMWYKGFSFQKPMFRKTYGGRLLLFRNFTHTAPQRCTSPYFNEFYMWAESRLVSHAFYDDRQLGKWLITYGDMLLRRFGARSKFDMINPKEKELVVVLNRNYGQGSRKILHAKELIDLLIKKVDTKEYDVEVWPYEFNFGSNMTANVLFARRIRVLIGVHGAGMSHLLFMRPGSVVVEVDSFRGNHQFWCFGGLALKSAMHAYSWSPAYSSRGGGFDFMSDCETDIHGVTDIVLTSLRRERILREAMLENAIDLFTNTKPWVGPSWER